MVLVQTRWQNKYTLLGANRPCRAGIPHFKTISGRGQLKLQVNIFVESLHKTELVSYICDCFINMNNDEGKTMMEDYASFIAEVKNRVQELDQETIRHKKSVISELQHANTEKI